MNDIPAHIRKPARYTGGEINAVLKTDPEFKIAISYPDIYEIGMSNLSLKILYEIINNIESVCAERVFAPAADMEQHLRENVIRLSSLESGRPVNDFDLIGFTLQYELCITNLLNILDLSGLKVNRRERPDTGPIVIAGGPILSNPEPYTDFVDLFVIGEAEELILKIVEIAREGKRGNKSKSMIIEDLSGLEGVYNPDKVEIKSGADGNFSGYSGHCTKRVFVKDLDSAPFPVKPVVPNLGTVHNRAMLEISRGCGRGCRFCAAGYFYRPKRERSVEKLRALAKEIIENTGYEEISLLSLSASDYSRLGELLTGINCDLSGGMTSISLPSLRIDNFTLEIAKQLHSVRKSGLTFALETADDNMRSFINKDITNEQFLSIVENVANEGWRRIKIYIMFGFPSLEGASDEVEILRELMFETVKRTRGRVNITVHLSAFVPKPNTPFQRLKFGNVDELREKAARFRSRLKMRNVDVRWNNIETSFLEAVICRGDRRLGGVIKKAWELGARFDGWDEFFNSDLWEKAFRECSIDPAYFAQREPGPGEPLPWGHIDFGFETGFFGDEFLRARDGMKTKDCAEECCACGMRCAEKEKAVPSGDVKINDAPILPEMKQQVKFKVDFRFTKAGRIRYISHLDMILIFTRALRRSGLPVYHTQGFNPHPKIVFERALALGIESLDEGCCIYFLRPVPPDEFREKMNPYFPEGIRIL